MGCDNSAEAGMPGMGKIKYHYFNIYGRGEPGRLLCWKAKVPFEDNRVPVPAWPNLKASFPYNGGGMPVAVLPNGKDLHQSKAIWRFLARRTGYYPTDPDVAFVHDWIIDTYYDVFDAITGPQFIMVTQNKSEGELKEMIDKLLNETVPGVLKRLMPHIKAAQNQMFILGNKPTFADCVLVTFYTDFLANDLTHSKSRRDALLLEYPEFKAYAEKVKMWAKEYYVQRVSSPV